MSFALAQGQKGRKWDDDSPGHGIGAALVVAKLGVHNVPGAHVLVLGQPGRPERHRGRVEVAQRLALVLLDPLYIDAEDGADLARKLFEERLDGVQQLLILLAVEVRAWSSSSNDSEDSLRCCQSWCRAYGVGMEVFRIRVLAL